MNGIEAPRFPDVRVTLSLHKRKRTAIVVVGLVRRALDRAAVPENVVELYVRQALSGDYQNAVMVSAQWVTIEAAELPLDERIIQALNRGDLETAQRLYREETRTTTEEKKS